MSLKKINKFAVSYCEIPEEIIKPSWIEEAGPDSYVECHISGNAPDDELEKWLLETYPELKDEESFLIHIDY